MTSSFSKLTTSSLRLFRYQNALALGFLYIATETHYSPTLFSSLTLVRAFAWATISAAAYAYNDLRDVAVDRVNHPTRPIPSGACTPSFASSLVVITTLIAIFLTLLGWQQGPWLPLFALLLGFFYSSWARSRSALMSNLLSSALVAAIPLSITAPVSLECDLLALGLAVITFARELQKDAIDQLGDTPIRSPALLIGSKRQLFSYIYPILIATAILLLFYALLFTPTTNALNAFFAAFAQVPLMIALLAWLHNAEDRQMQSRLLKAAAYLIVPILFIV